MKAVLVIDVPDDLLADPSDAYRFQIGGDAKVYYVRQGEKRGSIIGDTRDIKPMPNDYPPYEKTRKQDFYTEEEFDAYEKGWNDCFEELEK